MYYVIHSKSSNLRIMMRKGRPRVDYHGFEIFQIRKVAMQTADPKVVGNQGYGIALIMESDLCKFQEDYV